ncbi:MAG: Unknown protein [uncultured Sulfurovum sp.]|uniref:Uncharacterized protein n=1 Tax=uncultured Sulfurovum sp. TaxID=269237 RepID=A0A6S6T856_9BACT|nr:MAG: Unknown protein [uncultured Sulfurovum sp.]
MRHIEEQTITQLHTYLALLQTKETLETYREFCYQLYLLSLCNNETKQIAYTTIETTRAFTGHEQIAELSGLVHMNARVYDSDIGRFLSADTLIQDPHDSQSYNRYSYVRNNPLKYTDPTGHSWFSKLWKKVKKHIRTIAAVVVGVVIAVYAPQLLNTYLSIATKTLGSAVATGALAGFASGGIMTKSFSGALKGAAFGALGAGVAFGIGERLQHAGGIFTKGVTASKAFIKAASHGLSRGVISMLQGGTFKSGFASGFSASFFSPGTTMGGDGVGGFTLRTTIASIAGGTASELGGGKFSNGAVSGAFVHMFNAEMKNLLRGAYKNTASILNTMKNGDIVFGKRALKGVLMVQMGNGFDAIDQELVHEQVFFKMNGEVSNVGFSDGEWLINELPEGYAFSESYHTNNLNYVLSAAGSFNTSLYSLFGCNCQTFSTAVANRVRIDQGY